MVSKEQLSFDDGRWIDPQLSPMLKQARLLINDIDKTNSLTPEDYERKLQLADTLACVVAEILGYLGATHSRMIGD